MVVFPIRLNRTLFGLFHDGREPVLESPVTLVTEVLNAIPKEGVNTWEHLHVAKDAAELVMWLKQTPALDHRDFDKLLARIGHAMSGSSSSDV